MKIFYTLTDENTQHTNSQSKRFTTFEDALNEATNRIDGRKSHRSDGVYILKSVAFIRPKIVSTSIETIYLEDSTPQ